MIPKLISAFLNGDQVEPPVLNNSLEIDANPFGIGQAQRFDRCRIDCVNGFHLLSRDRPFA